MSTENTTQTKVQIISDTEIYAERLFNAPVELVYKAHIDPDLLPKWWGIKTVTTIVDQMDVRVGGTWRYIHRTPETEYGFRGEYKEVVPNKKLSYTFEFEPMPGHVLLETLEFEDRDGKTLMKITNVFASKEDRDGMINSGMEGGMNESHAQLDELLAQLTA